MNKRLAGLQRFAIGITLFNVLGLLFFGFEQPWIQPFVALATTYSLEIFFAVVAALAAGQSLRALPCFQNARSLIEFLLPAHITGLAVSMLLFSNSRMAPIVFACAVAIASKRILRVRVGNGFRHFLNPSNFGIAITLVLFGWVGISPPYQFSENFVGWTHWIVPVAILISGSLINARFSGRVPLILGWMLGFGLQAVLRTSIFDQATIAALIPMTGTAFILFTMYMITDPATTPSGVPQQIVFGVATAATYGALVAFHVVFGLFFALTLVCLVRGAWLYATSFSIEAKRASSPAPALAPVTAES